MSGAGRPSDWSWDQCDWVYGGLIEKLEWRENGVYAFDQSLAGKTVVLSLGEEWESTDEGSSVPGSGETTVLLQFLDAEPQPEQPQDTPLAKAGNQDIEIDGKPVQLDAITLSDDAGNGYNYFKLRDLGDALGFTVGYSRTRGVYVETK